MAYRIKRRDRGLTTALRRIAREQIDAARAEAAAPGDDPSEAIHQIRKHCKKLRGLLRLLRPGFDDFARENAAIRDLARDLSALRDTGALVETHDQLMIGARDGARFDPLRAHLVGLMPAGAAPMPDDLPGRLEELRARAARWSLTGTPRQILKKGVGKTWRRAAAGYRAARANPSVGNMHEWRKRVKYNWYHARLLRNIRPKRMQRHRDAAKRLSDLLGDHHDIAVYIDHLDTAAPPAIEPGIVEALKSRAVARKTELERRAFDMGAEMFAEKPAKLPKRWARWWKTWRKG